MPDAILVEVLAFFGGDTISMQMLVLEASVGWGIEAASQSSSKSKPTNERDCIIGKVRYPSSLFVFNNKNFRFNIIIASFFDVLRFFFLICYIISSDRVFLFSFLLATFVPLVIDK